MNQMRKPQYLIFNHLPGASGSFIPQRAPLIVALLFLMIMSVPALSANAQAPLREWKLSAKPIITVEDDGTPKTEFFRIRNVWRLTNGDIVVVDGSTFELRVFDVRGKFLHSFGRKGAGPGEFQSMQWNTHFGDTAIVYDGSSRRLTTISFAGAPRLLSTLNVRGDDEHDFNIMGRLRDGRWATRSVGAPNLRLPLGLQQLSGEIGLLGARADAAVNWLFKVPDVSIVVHNPDASSKMVSVLIAPFAPALHAAVTGTAIWFGHSATDSLVRYDALTGRRTSHRLPDAPIALTTRTAAAARERELADARTPSARNDIVVKYQSQFLPKNQPLFDELLPGYSDEVWVHQTADADDPIALGRYIVMSGTGRPTARVNMVPRFRVTDVNLNYVAGVYRDLDGVETVRVFSLTR
jgi:hypothetical protein